MNKPTKFSILFILLAITTRAKTGDVFTMPVNSIQSTSTASILLNDTSVLPKNKQPIKEKFVYAELVYHNIPGSKEGERWIDCDNISDENWTLIKKCKRNIEALDFMGQLGWELIAVSFSDFNNVHRNYYNVYYFKKKAELIR